MNRVKSLFIEKDEYQEFLEYVYLSNFGEREIFYESIFSHRLKDKVEFIKNLSKSTGKKYQIFLSYLFKGLFLIFFNL
jgi:hypothetical protein